MMKLMNNDHDDKAVAVIALGMLVVIAVLCNIWSGGSLFWGVIVTWHVTDNTDVILQVTVRNIVTLTDDIRFFQVKSLGDENGVCIYKIISGVALYCCTFFNYLCWVVFCERPEACRTAVIKRPWKTKKIIFHLLTFLDE